MYGVGHSCGMSLANSSTCVAAFRNPCRHLDRLNARTESRLKRQHVRVGRQLRRFRAEHERGHSPRRSCVCEEKPQRAVADTGSRAKARLRFSAWLSRISIVNLSDEAGLRKQPNAEPLGEAQIPVPRRPAPNPLPRFLNRERHRMHGASIAGAVLQPSQPAIRLQLRIDDRSLGLDNR